MKESIALLVTQWGTFQVSRIDGFGNQQIVSEGEDLQDCLVRAAVMLGHGLAIPISGPNSQV